MCGEQATSINSYLRSQQTQKSSTCAVIYLLWWHCHIGAFWGTYLIDLCGIRWPEPCAWCSLIVFTLAGRSLPGHAVKQRAGGESGPFPSGETAGLESGSEERSAGHLGVRDTKIWVWVKSWFPQKQQIFPPTFSSLSFISPSSSPHSCHLMYWGQLAQIHLSAAVGEAADTLSGHAFCKPSS